MALFYEFDFGGEKNDPQQVIYIVSEKERIGLAACYHHFIYWVLPERDLPRITKQIQEKDIKPTELSEQSLMPFIEAVKQAPQHPGLDVKSLDALLVQEFLSSINNPALNN